MSKPVHPKKYQLSGANSHRWWEKTPEDRRLGEISGRHVSPSSFGDFQPEFLGGDDLVYHGGRARIAQVEKSRKR
jgi:hypothetical protein